MSPANDFAALLWISAKNLCQKLLQTFSKIKIKLKNILTFNSENIFASLFKTCNFFASSVITVRVRPCQKSLQIVPHGVDVFHVEGTVAAEDILLMGLQLV